MCGIYGIVNLNQSVDRTFLAKQRDRLTHRGPDSSGIWISDSGHLGLAHRRLSIIDLTSAGQQPMVSNDGRFVIVYNGEVYNFNGLRSELEQKGCCFISGTDTEVVLSAYQIWGESCINRFNGMFAFAIYDQGDMTTAPSLFLARDRTGKKPIYYLQEQGKFQFGSELKALDVRADMDIIALNYYLALGYVPGENCLTQGVRKLPPAHAARLDLQSLHMKTWRYWDLPDNNADSLTDANVLADRAQELLEDAVQLRLISDVPLGVLLSGGMDSSLIVAAAARKSRQPVKTFTISFPGSKLDESSHALKVARYFNTDHHVLEARDHVLATLSEIAPLVDEPIADSSLKNICLSLQSL